MSRVTIIDSTYTKVSKLKKFSDSFPEKYPHLKKKCITPLTNWLKLRLHTAINRADFVPRCMLYTYEGNKMHS